MNNEQLTLKKKNTFITQVIIDEIKRAKEFFAFKEEKEKEIFVLQKENERILNEIDHNKNEIEIEIDHNKDEKRRNCLFQTFHINSQIPEIEEQIKEKAIFKVENKAPISLSKDAFKAMDEINKLIDETDKEDEIVDFENKKQSFLCNFYLIKELFAPCFFDMSAQRVFFLEALEQSKRDEIIGTCKQYFQNMIYIEMHLKESLTNQSSDIKKEFEENDNLFPMALVRNEQIALGFLSCNDVDLGKLAENDPRISCETNNQNQINENQSNATNSQFEYLSSNTTIYGVQNTESQSPISPR